MGKNCLENVHIERFESVNLVIFEMFCGLLKITYNLTLRTCFDTFKMSRIVN